MVDLIALVWLFVVTIFILIFYNRLRKRNKLHENQTLNLPKGLFRVILLLTILSLYIYSITTKLDIEYVKNIGSVVIVITGFYFGEKMLNNK